MKCPKCKNDLPDSNMKFCPFCGQKIEVPHKQASGQKKTGDKQVKISGKQKQAAPVKQYSVKRESQNQKSRVYAEPQQAPVRKKKSNKIVIAVCIVIACLAIGGAGFGVTHYILNGNSKTTGTEAKADRSSDREHEVVTVSSESDVKEETDTKSTSTESSSVSTSSAVSFSATSEDTEKTEKDTKTEKETNDKEAVSFTPDTETDGDAESSINQEAFGNNNSSSGSMSGNYGTFKVIDTDYVTLRSSATITNKNNKVLQIPGNSELTVLEVGCNGYWKVNYNGTEGYVLPSYLTIVSAGSKAVKKQCDYKIITDYVTLRDIPSTDGEDWGQITTGAIVEYYGSADNGFLLVAYNGQMGYILKSYNGETLVQKV